MSCHVVSGVEIQQQRAYRWSSSGQVQPGGVGMAVRGRGLCWSSMSDGNALHVQTPEPLIREKMLIVT